MLWLLGERQRYRVFAEKITATRVNKGLKLSEVMKRDCRTAVRSQPKSKNLDLPPARNLFPTLVLIARTDFLSGKKKPCIELKLYSSAFQIKCIQIPNELRFPCWLRQCCTYSLVFGTQLGHQHFCIVCAPFPAPVDEILQYRNSP